MARGSQRRVNLPNSSLVTTQYWGTFSFSHSLIPHKVLYVPEFSFNLISISRLIFNLHCNVTFSNNFCTIQDMNSLKTIGLAKLKDGLYHLIVNKEERCSPYTNSFINFSMTTPITKSNLWHLRLGHLSGKHLNILNELFPFISGNFCLIQRLKWDSLLGSTQNEQPKTPRNPPSLETTLVPLSSSPSSSSPVSPPSPL